MSDAFIVQLLGDTVGHALSAPSRNTKSTMARAVTSTIGALLEDVIVSEHFLKPFLVHFKYSHHRFAAVSSHDFLFEGLKIQVRPWLLGDNAEQLTLQQHVRLWIDNVRLCAWNEGTAQHVIGRACSLDYIEEACKTKEYTKGAFGSL
jgi:hypothetical protein